VPAQQDDPDERDQDHAELRLDYRCEDGQGRRALGVAAHQSRDGQHHHEGAERVGLSPDRRVVPRDRVEDVQRGREEANSMRIEARPTPDSGDPVDRQTDENVGHHRWQLDEGRRDPDRVAAGHVGQLVTNSADEPQYI
jgi:hypothetical protein